MPADRGGGRRSRDLAVIGAGKMGRTLLEALVSAGGVAKDRAVATVAHEDKARALTERLGVAAGTDNVAAAESAAVVLIAVKPQTLQEVLEELAPVLREDQLVVSVVTAASTRFMEDALGQPIPVVRAMPNTPALVREGMTVLAGGRHARTEHVARAREIFDAVGRTLELDERHFDAVTALSASGPAYAYVFLESLAEGGVKVGLPRGVATELVAQMCLGAARMVLATGEHPALLKDAVTTPSGCTIDGLLELEAGGFRVALIKAVVESARRAGELLDPGGP